MKSKNYRIAFGISILLVIICMLSVLVDKSKVQNIIVTMTAVIGAIAIWFEMKRSKDMAEGEFITSLNQSFLSGDDVKGLYRKLINNEEITEDDKLSIVEYLTFFETIFLLINRDVISIKLVNDLFYYRFNIAIKNKYIQQLELIPDAKYYTNIYTLDYIWRKYRKKKFKETNEENSLFINNKDYNKFVKVKVAKC